MADDGPAGGKSRADGQDDLKRVADEAIDERLAAWKRNAVWFVAGLGVLGAVGLGWQDLRLFLFERLFPPSAVYDRLKDSLREDEGLRLEVANDIVKLLGERVDSGYSKTIFFGRGAAPVYGQDFMQFYARPRQKVELTIRTQGDDPPDGQSPASFIITINNANIFENDKNKMQRVGYARFGADISSFLKFDRKPTLDLDPERDLQEANVFTLRVIPIDLPPDGSASFEILVLVRNDTAA
jgi:hypothetical protein